MAKTDEVVEMIDSEEELDSLLGNESGNVESKDSENEDGEENKKDEDLDDDKKPEAKSSTSTQNSNESEVEFNNVIDYINQAYDLGLNVQNLPKDLTREQEAEVVSDLFGQLLNGTEQKLKQYEDIEAILQDEEIKKFIEDKRATGKSLKEYISQYAKTVEGSEDEEVVRRITKLQYPDMSDEDINDIIEGYKDKGKLEKMADIARNNLKKADEQQAILEEQQYREEVQKFSKFVESIPDVYGVPLTKEMKERVVKASTERDKNGETYLDKVLSTDNGVFLASLAALHLKDLMSAKGTIKANRAQNRLIDRLYDDPSQLQSSGKDHEETGFSVDVANSF